MATLDQKHKEFLDHPFVGVASTLRKDGSPHNTVVWVDLDDRGLSFNTAVGRAKERHLREDPRVTVTIVDPQDAYHWLSVSGRAELTTDGADAQIDRLAKKYLGKDEYPWRSPEEQRISVRISADKLDSSGFDG